mgnify:CR=1 FL=1
MGVVAGIIVVVLIALAGYYVIQSGGTSSGYPDMYDTTAGGSAQSGSDDVAKLEADASTETGADDLDASFNELDAELGVQ